ncbi:hypothetical protein EAF00_009397 [Botryotinia globosa]|nr:hypothetical protein EAF00_009397 [Botryotinia globosa]
MASMDKAQPLDETTDPESSPGITSNRRSTDIWVVFPVDSFPADGTHPIQQLLESFGPQSVTKLRTASSLTIMGILYWTLLLTPSEVKMLEESPLVYDVSRPVIASNID